MGLQNEQGGMKFQSPSAQNEHIHVYIYIYIYYTILYYTILYYTILYYTILYYTPLSLSLYVYIYIYIYVYIYYNMYMYCLMSKYGHPCFWQSPARRWVGRATFASATPCGGDVLFAAGLTKIIPTKISLLDISLWT